MSKIGEWVKGKMQSWLEIVPAASGTIVLQEKYTRETEIMRSKLWYRGDADELHQFFHQLGVNNGSFWASAPGGSKVRKIHSGLPAIIADTLAYIVTADLDQINVGCDIWEDLEENTKFRKILKRAVVDSLICGDGAFKICVDGDVSDYPIIEFISGENIEFEETHGIVTAVVFHDIFTCKSRRFELRERYGKGFIETRLFDSNGKEYPLETIPELADIEPYFTFDGDFMLAVPLKFYESEKYKGRGKSIFDGGKSDCFDALDEVVSQWIDALRQGRVQKYIPESLMPRNPENGSLARLNSFGTEFITIGSPLGDGDSNSKIQVVQPDIKYDAFVSSYTHALLMCLQGLVSPATLGIDVGKMSSADAQREKKDVTGNTRNTITGELEKVLPELISAVLKTYDLMQGSTPGEYDINVSFGEYGAPDFDSRVETIGKAAQYGIMSIEKQVAELWGSSMDEEEQASEVERIKAQRGVMSMNEPTIM